MGFQKAWWNHLLIIQYANHEVFQSIKKIFGNHTHIKFVNLVIEL